MRRFTLLAVMGILLAVPNLGSQRAEAVREALKRLVLDHYPGGLQEAAEDLGYPYKTFWRNLTTQAKERNDKLDLGFVLAVHEQLRGRFDDVGEFIDFYADATRDIG